jgi:NADH-quinone oxidoreductase subunit J
MTAAFVSLAALTIVPALFVITARNLVHAGFAMLPCLIGVAGLYALLEAHLFVAVQVLIYIGAILVLILFALMLTRDVMDPQEGQRNGLGMWAGFACGAGALVSAHILFHHPWPRAAGHPLGAHEQTAALGTALIGRYALPFEAASVILLAALIGAIVVAKGSRPSRGTFGSEGVAES